MSNIQLPDEVKIKLKEIHDELVGDSIGVYQAIKEMNKSMDKVNAYLSTQEHEKAADMGYTEISSNFIFLQRCLGGLHRTMMNKDVVIQNLAFETKMSFEDVASVIEEQLKSLK